MSTKKKSTKKSTKKNTASAKAAPARARDKGTGKAGPGKAKPAGSPGRPVAGKRLSALEAAAKLLAGTGKPMRTGDLIVEMKAKGLWESPGGKTPAATLSAAIGREIAVKGAKSRFRKADRGLFAATKEAAR